MNDQTKLSEEKQKKIALRAITDITNLARLHNLPEGMIMVNIPIKDFVIAVYQAGASMAMEEMMEITKKTLIDADIKKITNPDDIPF